MGIFDRFSKPKPPKGYCEVKAEFTEEESKAIRRALKRFPTIADADAPDGMEVVVPLKVKDGITAQGLAEYAVDLIHEVEGPASDGKLPLMDKAIKAVMKAYVHS